MGETGCRVFRCTTSVARGDRNQAHRSVGRRADNALVTVARGPVPRERVDDKRADNTPCSVGALSKRAHRTAQTSLHAKPIHKPTENGNAFVKLLQRHPLINGVRL